MKKILLIIAMAVVGISAQAQLLWKVSGNGLQKPSYIFGTHHYAPLTVLDSVPQIRQVQNDVEQVCGEVDMLNTRDLTRLTAEAIMLPPGSSLNDFIPDNIYIDKSASGICDAAEMAAACEGSNMATPLTTPAILIIATSSMPQMSICVIPTSPMPMILPAIN
jgi:uncharacterized protein